jgi:hypothetical protein
MWCHRGSVLHDQMVAGTPRRGKLNYEKRLKEMEMTTDQFLRRLVVQILYSRLVSIWRQRHAIAKFGVRHQTTCNSPSSPLHTAFTARNPTSTQALPRLTTLRRSPN